jgi:hypothetical protein
MRRTEKDAITSKFCNLTKWMCGKGQAELKVKLGGKRYNPTQPTQNGETMFLLEVG